MTAYVQVLAKGRYVAASVTRGENPDTETLNTCGELGDAWFSFLAITQELS